MYLPLQLHTDTAYKRIRKGSVAATTTRNQTYTQTQTHVQLQLQVQQHRQSIRTKQKPKHKHKTETENLSKVVMHSLLLLLLLLVLCCCFRVVVAVDDSLTTATVVFVVDPGCRESAHLLSCMQSHIYTHPHIHANMHSLTPLLTYNNTHTFTGRPGRRNATQRNVTHNWRFLHKKLKP